MISLIERGETSATAAVLGKLAQALQVPLAFLFEEPAGSAGPQPLARAAQQQCWQDPATGYVRRHLSPSGYAAPLELVVLSAFALGVAVGALGMVPRWWSHRSAARRASAPAPAQSPAAPTPETEAALVPSPLHGL